MNNYQNNIYSYGEKLGIKLPFPPIEPKLLALFFAVSIYSQKPEGEVYKNCRHRLSSFDRKCLKEFEDTNKLNPFELVEKLEEAKENSIKAACFEVLTHLGVIEDSDEYWQDLSKKFYEKIVDTDLNYYSSWASREDSKYYFCAKISGLKELSDTILNLEKGTVVFFGEFPKNIDDKEFKGFNDWLKQVNFRILFIRELNPKVSEKLSRIEGISSGTLIRTDKKNLLVLDEGYAGQRLKEKDVDAVIGNTKIGNIEVLAPFINYQSGNFVMNHNSTIIKGIPINKVASI